MKPAYYLFFLLFTSILLGQSAQGEYLEAKRQFGLGNYEEARLSFSSLTDDKVFGEYASFFYGLSSLRLNEVKVAEDMFRQIQSKYPDWDQQTEVAYWLTYSAFQQKKYWKAFKEADSLPKELREQLIDRFLGALSLGELDSAYALNPDNEIIGSYYARAIISQPYEDQDKVLLKELADKFKLDVRVNESLPLIKKDEYAVAVVLPFMFDSLATPQTVIRNSIIFDLYQGMQLASRDLEEEDIRVNLFPFDSKKKRIVTDKIIEGGFLDEADLIVGPLFTGPSQSVSEFAKSNKVTMINPLSSNDAVTQTNSFAYLFRPSFLTQAREAANYASSKFIDNKKVFIFYETKRDSLIAKEYLDTIEEEGYFVVRFYRLNNEDAQQIQKDFTEQYEYRIDTIYSQVEMDSIAEIPGRIVRTRSLRNESTGRIIRDEEGEEVIETYEMKFSIQPDSIGHIFAATSSNLLANNLISMIEVRTDSIGLIGYENWLDFSLVSYDQLERLQINFLSPTFYDRTSNNYSRLAEDFVREVGVMPNEYHIYGYELTMQVGRLLSQYGVYPQRGWSNGDKIEGTLMEGLRYGIFQDNQVVPITTLEDLELINQNTKQEVVEDDENRDE